MDGSARPEGAKTALQMLTAPGERRVVGCGEVEVHHRQQRVQEPFGLAEREMVDEPQGQGGLDRDIRLPLLPASCAAPAWCPGGDPLRRQPQRHIAASHEGLVVGRPVCNAVSCLVLGMHLRLHPCSVARLDSPGTIRPWFPCNNAPERQRGFDREVRVLQLPSTRTGAHDLPGGECLRGEPQRDVTSLD